MLDLSSRHNELARALFNLVASKTLNLEEAIRAVVILEGERPERSFAAGERYWAGHLAVGAGGAGVRSEILLRNPPDSNVLSTLLWMNAGTAFVGYADGTDLPAGFGVSLASITPADRRWGDGFVPGTTTVHIKNTLAATGIRALGQTATGAGFGDMGTRPFIGILPPGAQVIIMATVDNATISASYFGREVPLVKGIRG